MAPKKQADGNTNRENLIWTKSMDDALVDAFMKEYNEGHKVNGTFTTTAYKNIVQELSAMFGKKIDKKKVKNRWKTLKKHFVEVYDIFKNGMSGFAWSPSTHLWDAKPEAWDALIESKPKVAIWRNTPFPHYEKMVILYGNDRATREDADTTFKMRRKRPSATEEYFAENVDDVDNLVSQNEVILKNIDSLADVANDNISNFSAQVSSQGATSGNNKKKKKEKDNEFSEMNGAMYEVAKALREGNAIMREYHQYKLPPISGEETWNLIQECGCDITLLPKIYCFLMNDINKLRTISQCPVAAHKEVIMEMVFGSSNQPSN